MSAHRGRYSPWRAVNFIPTGIVHLPPPLSNPSSEVGSALGHVYGGSMRSRDPRSHIQRPLAGSSSGSQGITSSDGRSRPPVGSVGVQSGSDSADDSSGKTVRLTSSISSGLNELVTFRFEHVSDEHGFHIVTYREGTLTTSGKYLRPRISS